MFTTNLCVNAEQVAMFYLTTSGSKSCSTFEIALNFFKKQLGSVDYREFWILGKQKQTISVSLALEAFGGQLSVTWQHFTHIVVS